MVFFFLIPGYLLNFGLMYGATHLLDVGSFGIFYTANSLISVISAPALILGLFFARRFAETLDQYGQAAVIADYRRFVVALVKWGGLAALSLMIFMAIFGQLIGVKTLHIGLLIVLGAYVFYLADSVRAVFQGLRKFVHLGVTGLGLMATRFTLAITAIYVIGTAWAGLTGILLAFVLVFAVGYRFLTATGEPDAAMGSTDLPNLVKMAPFLSSYGLLIILMYADIMQAYLGLGLVDLGRYSASSILPKAILIITMPVIQVFFSVMVGQKKNTENRRVVLVKGLGATLLVSTVAVGVITLLSDFLCEGTYGLKECQGEIMAVLALSTVPLCLLRVLVVSQLATTRDWHPLVLLIPAIPYFIYVQGSQIDAGALANAFMVFSFTTFFFYSAVALVTSWRVRPVSFP